MKTLVEMCVGSWYLDHYDWEEEGGYYWIRKLVSEREQREGGKEGENDLVIPEFLSLPH